jgi:hypothetical protein
MAGQTTTMAAFRTYVSTVEMGGGDPVYPAMAIEAAERLDYRRRSDGRYEVTFDDTAVSVPLESDGYALAMAKAMVWNCLDLLGSARGRGETDPDVAMVIRQQQERGYGAFGANMIHLAKAGELTPATLRESAPAFRRVTVSAEMRERSDQLDVG